MELLCVRADRPGHGAARVATVCGSILLFRQPECIRRVLTTATGRTMVQTLPQVET
jgi:hypothetical protein